MKALDVLRHPQPFAKLNLSPLPIDEFLALRLNRIGIIPAQTIPILDEIREVIFRVPINEVEVHTKPICLRLVGILGQLGVSQASPELMRLRTEILEMLWVLNFHFTQDNRLGDSITTLFKFINDGSLDEMSAAIRIVRQTFEHVDPVSKNILLTIGGLTLKAGENRLAWLLKNEDRIDSDWYFPFLTLLTVLSFCGKSFDQIHDPICDQLAGTKQFLLSHKEDTKARFSKYLPTVAIKARMVHSAMLSVDCPKRDMKMDFLPEAYVNLSKCTPMTYQSIHDELASSLVFYLSQKIDDKRIARVRSMLPYFLDYCPMTAEAYYSVVSVVFKIYEVAVMPFKSTWETIEPMIYFTAKLLDMPSTPVPSRVQRFYKMAYDLLRRATFESEADGYYYAELIGIVKHGLEDIMEEADEQKIDPSIHSAEMESVHDVINEVAAIFDSFAKLMDFFNRCMKTAFEFQAKSDRLHLSQAKRTDPNQRFITLQLPLDSFMTNVAIETYITGLFTLVRLRKLWHKCNLKFSQDSLTSNYESAMKSCEHSLVYTKLFEKVRHFNMIGHKLVMDSLTNCTSQLIVTTVWQGFLKRLIRLNDPSNLDSSFLRTLFSNTMLLTSFFEAAVWMILENIEQNKPITEIVFLVTFSLEKMMDGIPAQTGDRKDSCLKQLSDAFETLRDTINRTYTRLPEVHKLFLLMTETAKYIEAFLGKSGFCRSMFSSEFVGRMTCFFRTMPDEDSVLLRFLFLCNKYAPETVESDSVIAYLVGSADKDSLKIVTLLDSIRTRKRDLISGDEIGKKIAPAALECIKLPVSQRTEAARRLAKTFMAGYESSFPELNERHDAILVKDGHRFQMNAHHLLMTLSQTALENEDCENTWRALRETMIRVLDPNDDSDIHMATDFCDPSKIVGFVCLSMASRAEFHRKSVGKFFESLVQYLRRDVRQLAVILCSVIRYRYMLPDTVFDLSVIDSSELFDDFLDECIKQTESKSPNMSICRIPICSLILDQCQSSIVNMRKFTQFVVRTISVVQIDQETIDFVLLDKFKFEELCLLPGCIKNVIVGTKELVKQVKEDYSYLLENLECSSCRNTRLISAELLASSGMKSDKVTKFVAAQLEKPQDTVEQKLVLLDVCSLCFRLAQGLLTRFRGTAESILTSLDLDKLPSGGINIVLSSLEPLLSGGKTDPEFVNEKLVQLVLSSVGGTPIISRVILLMFSSSNKERQKDIWRFLVTKIKEDGLVDFGKDQHTNLGNWPKIIRYWRSLYLLSPSVFATAVVAQLAGLASEAIEITSSEVVRNTFDILCRLLTVSQVRKYVSSGNMCEKAVDSILTICRRCNVIIKEASLQKIASFVLEMGKNGVEYLRKKFLDTDTTAIVTLIVQCRDNKKLFEEFMSDTSFILDVLESKDAPTKTQFHMVILCPYTDEFSDLYIEPALKITARLLSTKLHQFYALPVIEALTDNYEKLGLRTIDLILQMAEDYDHRNYGFMKRLIRVFLSDSRTTIELICEMVSDKKEQMFDVLANYVVTPFVEKHVDCAQGLVAEFGSVHQKICAIELCLRLVPDYSIGTTEVRQLYAKSDNDQDKDRLFVIWTKAVEDGGFNELFDMFIGTLSVHISLDQKAVCEGLKIPRTASVDRIAGVLESHIHKFMRHPAPLVGIWRILVNNAELFAQPLVRFWKVIVIQMSGMRFYAKKTQIMAIIPLCEILTELLCRFPLVPNVSHYVVYYYGGFLVQTLRGLIDNSGFQLKRCVPFMECCYQMAQKFGSQLRVVQDYCAMFVECCTKIMPYGPQESNPQQQHSSGQSQQNNATQSISQFVHEVMFPYASKMITVALKFDPPYISEQFVEVLFGSVTINCPSWPQALYGLSLIAQAGMHMDRIRRLLDLLDKDTIGPAIFPLFWANDSFSDLRTSKLLPFAVKYCTKEQIDTPIAGHLTNVVLKTMMEYPHGQTLQRLFNEIQPSGKKICTALLPGLLSTPPKARFVTNFIDGLLQNPDVCIVLPSVVKETGSNYQWTNLAKMAFCLQRSSETCLEELEGVDIRSLTSLARSAWGISIPLTMILHYFLPFGLTLKQVFTGIKILRSDFVAKVVDDFFLYSASPYVPDDTELREKPIFSRDALGRWAQVEDAFPSLSEVQVSDICDGRKALEGFSLSRINLFLHHGMTHQALFSYKESLNDLSKEDLAKIQVRDDAFPTLTINSVGESAANYTEVIEQSIRGLPPASRCPYSDKLASYIFARKYMKLHRVMKGEKKLRFYRPLSHFFSPQAHKAFANLRKVAYKLVPAHAGLTDESIHTKQYNRSLHQHFVEQRPPLPAPSDLFEQENPDCKQLLLCFVKYIRKEGLRQIFEHIVVEGLRACPTKPIFIAALYSLLQQGNFDFGDCVSQLPSYWIPAFTEMGVKKVCPETYTAEFEPDFRAYLDRLVEIDMDSAEDGEFYCMSVEFLTSCESCSVPLSSNGAKIASIDPIVIYDKERIAFLIRSTLGEDVPFVITREPLQPPAFAAFMGCVSSLLSNFVDSAKRGQSLVSCSSIRIKEGFWLTQTSAVPLSSLADGKFCKLTANWNTSFAYKYAALCAVQCILKAAPFDDSSIWVDESRCQIIVRSMAPSPDGKSTFNMIPRYLDEMMISGPFRAGLLSAFICFSYSKEKLQVFLETILGVDSSNAVASAVALSIADRPDSSVITAIDSLIACSIA